MPAGGGSGGVLSVVGGGSTGVLAVVGGGFAGVVGVVCGSVGPADEGVPEGTGWTGPLPEGLDVAEPEVEGRPVGPTGR